MTTTYRLNTRTPRYRHGALYRTRCRLPGRDTLLTHGHHHVLDGPYSACLAGYGCCNVGLRPTPFTLYAATLHTPT